MPTGNIKIVVDLGVSNIWRQKIDKMNLKQFVAIAVLLSAFAGLSEAENILCLFGVATESAAKWNSVLVKELAASGHVLTVVTPAMQWEDDSDNIRFIYLEHTQKFLKERYENNQSEEILKQYSWKSIVSWYDIQMATCRGNLDESTGFSEVLHMVIKEKKKFDLILYDITYGPACLLQIAYFYENIPIVAVTSDLLNNNVLQLSSRNILQHSIDPYILSDFPLAMSYWQRLYNTVLNTFDYSYRQWVVRPVIEGIWSHNRHIKHLIPQKSLSNLLPRIKIVLANYHSALQSFDVLPTNIVPVAGLHIPELPTVYHLTGENSKASSLVYIDLDISLLNEEHLKNLLSAVNYFQDYLFIWQSDLQLKQSKPKNLLIKRKSDASSVLAHEKCILYITAPDNVNMIESIYYAMPTISITLNPYQRYIAKRTVERGVALNLELSSMSSASLIQTIKSALDNQNLKTNLQDAHSTLVNQPIPPIEMAIWWIEHILDNPQTNDHLQTQQLNNLGFISRNSLDVYGLFALLVLMCMLNAVLVFREIYKNFKTMAKNNKKRAKEERIGTKTERKKEKSEKSKEIVKTKKNKTKTS